MGLSKFFRRALVCFQASDDTDNRSNANSKTRSADEAKEKDQSSVVEAQTAVGAQHGDQQKKTEEENATKNLADAPAQQTASTPTGPDQAIVDETAVTAVVTQSSIPKCECVHLRRKLLSRRYDFDEGYMFTEQPISTLKMTHEVALSLPSGERVTASQIDHANKAKIIEDLSPLARGDLKLNCVYNRIEEKKMLGPYRAKITAKGMPFLPVFWLFEDLITNQSLDELRRQIQSYVDRNIGTLGQWRVVFASCRYTACMNASQSIFTGNVLVVTDAETMYSARIIPPAFQDIQPRRRYTAELPI
ncbi:hypothetical protein NDA11_001993 [Ustilago hordei]|uniref:Uncharacterized protein n=1 Tax=Ustilago hordei TaxID=120017 RepID=I2FYX8_USTHO|nr:uncharacterized protein UHO2_06822 [Ustilago hordei]KAJ1036832.1 hypothetical protein NDA10_006022 [Ustilago hordei]KAJ1577040.1 hypothetical protein NDA15_005652 [Ustilago hordei]KAJ1578518.1 hypothetical protein NDA12_001155 [Ustilago hordei]KAJ1583994.1 hypothetical protein NDA11_001993 [Ustilago hordei]UTT91244.1 hypothetical protein NDA17_001420 [Ustilago hordei]